MHDDYRVQLPIGDDGAARRLFDDLRGHSVVADARRRLGDRVVVTHADGVLFAYADAPELAMESARLLESVAADRGQDAHATVARWHPEEERWEPADVAMPATPEEHAEEQRRLDALEAASAPTWEVHVELSSHADTVALARRLEEEGHTVTRRWSFLFVAVPDEREADALAARLTADLPEGTPVHVEGSEAAAMGWQKLHPFALLGGLGN